MADAVDISGMPDPGTIGLSPAGPGPDISSMPAPEDLYTKHYGSAPASKDLLDEFMANPPPEPTYQPTLKKSLSMLTGLPRAAAGVALAVPAGVASVAGQLSGAGGAIVDPTNAASYLEQGRDRGREWASKVNNLANYVPATERGAALSNDLTNLPGNLIKETAGAGAKAVLPDNAYQAVSDIAQDVGTDLPALGAPAAVRGVAKGVKAAAGAAKGAVASEAATLTPTNAEAPAPLTPPVGTPITGDTLRATPNPIPAPEGTIHQAVHPAALEPQEAAAPNQPPAESQPAAAASRAAPKAEPPAAAPEPSTAAPSEAPAEEPAAQSAAPTAAPTAAENASDSAQSPGDAQRGSVRLFNSPAEEGPKETPAPEEQDSRAASLDAIDHLSGGGLPTRRLSAVNGDYNATGDDWQAKEVGSQPMRQQIASENAAMHTATENVHNSIGSEFENSVDTQTMGDRGRVTRGAIQGIEGWFDKATDQMYDAARTANQGKQMPKPSRMSAYLNDDSNFTNDAEIGLQRAAKQRMDRLWSTGDPDKGTPPGSVNAAERLREFLNEKGKNPSAMGVAGDMKNHLDLDVAEHGGPGLFQTARAMRRHSYQMLEEPTGIKKLLAPADSQGINHAIPEHKVMDYIADLSREQHEHVLNVLRAGAHLGGGELAEGSAAALREIQAHVISRMHNAATNADGSWNARKFYNAADRYARNAPDTFKDRPDVLQNLKTINDAGNVLHMDKHYPGAIAQGERTGLLGHALQGAGNLAASVAHEIPMGGRMIGRAIERGVENAKGGINEASRDRAVNSRLVDRNGKQRGSVQVMPSKEGSADSLLGDFHSRFPEPASTGYSGKRVGNANVDLSRDPFDPNRAHVEMLRADEMRQGQGHRALKRVTDLADKHGTTLQLDATPVGKGGPNATQLKDFYQRHGFSPDTDAPAATANTMTREPRGGVRAPSGQRGSFSFQNDNDINRATAGSRAGMRGADVNPRNARSEYNANRQIAGNPGETAERAEILRRLSGTPIEDWDSGRVRTAVAAYKKAQPAMFAGQVTSAAKKAGVEPKEMWRRIVEGLTQ